MHVSTTGHLECVNCPWGEYQRIILKNYIMIMESSVFVFSPLALVINFFFCLDGKQNLPDGFANQNQLPATTKLSKGSLDSSGDERRRMVKPYDDDCEPEPVLCAQLAAQWTPPQGANIDCRSHFSKFFILLRAVGANCWGVLYSFFTQNTSLACEAVFFVKLTHVNGVAVDCYESSEEAHKQFVTTVQKYATKRITPYPAPPITIKTGTLYSNETSYDTDLYEAHCEGLFRGQRLTRCCVDFYNKDPDRTLQVTGAD